MRDARNSRIDRERTGASGREERSSQWNLSLFHLGLQVRMMHEGKEQQVRNERSSIIFLSSKHLMHCSLLPSSVSISPSISFACARKVEKDASFRTGSDPATDTHPLRREEKHKESS